MGTTASRILDLEWAFQYLTVDEGRAAGLTVSAYPAESDVWKLLQRICKHVNQVTEQVFAPVYLAASVDGMGDRLIPSPHDLPILQLDSLVLEPSGTSVDSSVYSVEDRCVQLRTQLGLWSTDEFHQQGAARYARRVPQEVDAVTLSGWFGWLEGRIPRRAAARAGGRRYLQLEVTTDVSAHTDGDAGVEIPVDDVAGVKAGQSVAAKIVEADDYLGLGLVVEVDGSSIFVDFLEENLVEGDQIFVFPPPPSGVVQATKILAATPGNGIGSAIPGVTGPGVLPVGYALTEERVDNYQWKASTSGRPGDQAGSGQRTTGVAAADALLQFYVRPARVFLV